MLPSDSFFVCTCGKLNMQRSCVEILSHQQKAESVFCIPFPTSTTRKESCLYHTCFFLPHLDCSGAEGCLCHLLIVVTELFHTITRSASRMELAIMQASQLAFLQASQKGNATATTTTTTTTTNVTNKQTGQVLLRKSCDFCRVTKRKCDGDGVNPCR